MSGILRDENEIDAVLCEFERGVSEGDIAPQIDEEDYSEVSDNEEYESEHPTSADDTDADPNYYPSDEEQRPVIRRRGPVIGGHFFRNDTEDKESSAESMELCDTTPNVSRPYTNIPTEVFDPSVPSTSTHNSNFAIPNFENISSEVLASTVPSTSINRPSSNVVATNSETTTEQERLSNEPLQINNGQVSNVSTIITIDIDSLEQDEDPSYHPTSGDSSSDESCISMEINPTEETDLDRTLESNVCTDSHGQNAYLTSVVSHKNIALLRKRSLTSKNGHKWSSKSKTRSNRPERRNIVHFRQRPIGNAQNIVNPADCFKLFISDNIVNDIVAHTNEEISRKRESYSQQSATVSPTNAVEINALLGLLVLSAAMKDNHLTSKELFDPTFSGTRYVSVMSRERFDFLLNSLRFDDKASRADRRKVDKFAPIRDIWESFIELCRRNYCPGSFVCIDEQLLGFRGRCPFKMYLPSKPNKYGIKIIMLCDVKTKYLIDGTPYLGKNTNTSGLPLGAFFTKELTKTIHGTNRNVTMDNWFSSIPLAKDMLSSHQLTVVGTLRGDKKEIPPEMRDMKSRKIGSVLFCYDNELILVSYKAKKSKMVYLISTTHEKGTIAEPTGKAEIVEFYNSTKGAVDAFDEMSSNMSSSRKTQRWPLCIFYGMINSTLVNAYVIYVHNMVKEKKKPLSRREFAKLVCEELTKPHLQNRVEMPTLRKNLKTKIKEILGEETVGNDPEPQGPVGRKICAFCPSKKRRMTRFSCFNCKTFYCLEHQAKMCTDCSSMN